MNQQAWIVHAYIRASTEDQTTQQQRDAIVAAYPPETRFQFYEEHESGWQGKRSEYDALLQSIIKGRCKELVAVNIARLGRNQRQAIKLLGCCLDMGVKIKLLDTPLDFNGPFGPAIFMLLSALAAMDSDMKSQNIKRKFALKRKQQPNWLMHGNVKGTVSAATKKKAPEVFRMLDEGKTLREVAELLTMSVTNVQKVKKLRGKMLLTRADYAKLFPNWHLLPIDQRPPIPDA